MKVYSPYPRIIDDLLKKADRLVDLGKPTVAEMVRARAERLKLEHDMRFALMVVQRRVRVIADDRG